MSQLTRKIGLSLGADICWPICYEELMKRLDLSLSWQGDTIRFEVERVEIEPFNLRRPCPYDLVIDRLTHWYHISREWIKKSIVMDDLYVFNNPWSLQSMEKQTSYSAMMKLGLPVPETWMIPAKEYDHQDDLQITLERYARLFDLGKIGGELGYPLFMKPYDGGAWVGVSKIDDEEQLKEAYDASGKRVMNLQKAALPYDYFVRCIGLGPQVRMVNYDPSAPLHDRYKVDIDFLSKDEASLLEDMTMTINTFFGWDFNSCEALRHQGTWCPIDFANACPDSQVTSLHYHFPWLIKANIRWSVFCSTVLKPMHRNQHWQPYFDVAEKDLPYRERLSGYARIARERHQADRFEEFCATHLSHLDEVADEFFASDVALGAVREKVEALYPENEIDHFTDLFWGRIQDWRRNEGGGSAPGG